MTDDAAVLAVLADGPLTVEQVACRTGLDVDAVEHRLRRMFGVRVTRAGLVWRLLDTTAGSRTANLVTATDMLAEGLRVRRLAGETRP